VKSQKTFGHLEKLARICSISTSRHYKKTPTYRPTSRNNGIHLFLRTAESTREELGMWVDHFLLPTQFSALHAHKLSLITYAHLAVVIVARLRSLEGSVRRKEKLRIEKERLEQQKEADLLEQFL